MLERQDTPLQVGMGGSRSSAFASLHREHAVGVYNLALRLLGNRDDARDITQEVFLRAYQYLDGSRKLERAWFYKVTVNACYDHMRRAKVRPQMVDMVPDPPATIDGYEQADLARYLDWTLRQLPPQQRAALLLREVHGLQYEEIADALGVQRESIGVTLTRARGTFKRHFVAVSGIGEAAMAKAAAGKRRLATALDGAAAFSFILPGLRLPTAPLPASLEVASLLASATGAGVGVGAGAALGLMGKIAAALSTKAAVVGAGATLVTGSIGGAYVAQKAQHPPTSQAQAVQGPARPGATPASAEAVVKPSTPSEAVVAKPPASPSPSVTAVVATPSATGSPAVETPSAVAEEPLPSPSATTVSEASPQPETSPTPEAPAETPTPIPTTVCETSPEPEPSPTTETPSPAP